MSELSVYLALWAVFWILMLGACALAFLRGGPAERWGAALIFFFALLWEGRILLPPDAKAILQLIGDGLTALGLLVIAMRYASLWLGAALMFQAIQFSLHSFYFVTNRPQDALQIIINNTNLFAILSCLIIGSLMSWRQKMRSASVSGRARPTPAL
jgi:hypothetical protein